MVSYLPLIGGIFFLFRLWLIFFKLTDELQFRRLYISRFYSLYFALAITMEFRDPTFNALIIGAVPMMLISFVGWDLPFYQKFVSRTYWTKNHGWLLVERLSMHLPILICGIWMYVTDFHNYVPHSAGVLPFVLSAILLFLPFFLMDERWTSKYIAPTGKSLLFGAIACYLGFVIVCIFL